MNFNRFRTTSLILLVTLPVAGCGGYGSVSPTGYEYSKALYALSNKQKTARIDQVEKQIEADTKAGKLPEHEATWLQDICQKCQAQQWKSAQADARRMMEDQVQY